MSGKRRRNPSLAGVAGLTASDLDALDQGRTTLQTIADRVGCSKQAVSRKLKAMRATAPAGPSIPTSPTASTGPISIPPGAVLIDVQQAVISVNLAVIHRAAGILEGPDALGPSAVKMLAGAVALARAELAVLGVLASDDDESTLSTLTVRVMTEEEHVETKRKAEKMNDYED